MSMKIGNGRGKKGDGLVINRETKQRSYSMARNCAMFSNEKIGEMLMNVNTRAKDKAKLYMEVVKRA